MRLDDFRMGDSVAFDEKARKFEEEDEEECGDVLFLRSELIGTEYEPTDDGHYATHEDQEAEELQKEIEKRPNGARLEFMGKRKKRKIFAKFDKVPCGKSFDHVHNKGGHKTKDQ